MLLDPDDRLLFYKLHQALMSFVNQRLKVVEPPSTGGRFPPFPTEQRLKVRQALLEHLDLIDAFVAEDPFEFSPEDLAIVGSWKDLVAGKFVVFRCLKKHTIFLTLEEPVVAYGVLALSDPFEALIGPYLPVMCQAVLLPFKGRIIYDGLLTSYNMSFGGGYRRSFKESHDRAKERTGIVTKLPFTPESPWKVEEKPKPKERATRARKSGGKSLATEKVRRAYDAIVALTDAFCRDHLDAEYEALCRKLAEKLARKRASPLASGKPESWASGIVRVIGWVNFLGDPSQPHHMKMTDIDEAFGVSEATGSAKAKAIRDLLKLRSFDPEWTLPCRLDQNPLVWMIQVNGLIVDARHIPREIQEEAYRKGLIPYIPGERAEED